MEGVLSFIYHVKRESEKKGDESEKNRLFGPNSITKLYRTFLFYKHFFSLNKPLIICEGKTDNIYLKSALNQLEKSYQEFIKKDGDKYIYKLGFLNKSKNLLDVLAVSDGTSGLLFLMRIYKEYMKNFEGAGKKHPVIILIDNDSGSKEIIKHLGKTGKPIKPLKEYYHFVENLYVVFVPSIGGKETDIEGLFDKSILDTKVDGKSFKRNVTNHRTEYSKTVFANKVIKANQNNINFDQFREVFDRFKNVINDYDQKCTPIF